MSDAPDIEIGEHLIHITGSYAYFKFVPETSNLYTFTSVR